MVEAGKKTILLVEDQALIALSEKKALEKYGYAVITVDTGEGAIDFLNNGCIADLILMDINLGNGIDGTVASQRILEKHNLPIVFLSSHSEPEVVEKTGKITSYGYILKNSSITVLDASVKMAFKLFDANNKLKASESSLAHAEKISKIGNWRLFLNSRELVPSDGACSIYGIEKGKATWEDIKKIPLDEYREMLDKKNSALISNNEPYDVEFKIRRATDGKIVDIRCISEYNKATNIVIGVIEDITERNLEREDLQKQKNLLSSIIESSSESIFAKDMTGRYQLMNSSGAHVFGYRPSEIIGRTDFDLCPRETALRFAKDDALVTENNKIIERETTFVVDGEGKTYLAHKSPWVDGNLKTIGVIGISNNISKLKLLENETNQFRNRLALAMTAAKLVWWELNTRTFEVAFDKRIVGMFGYSPEKFQTAQDFFALVHPDDYKNITRVVPILASGQISKYGTECRVMAVGGQYKWYRIIACIIKDGATDPPYNFTGVLMDIDEQKKADTAISNLLEEKEIILKEVHHRMKNNMRTIQSLLSLQASSLENSTAIRALEDASGRLNSMMLLYEKLYQSSGYLSSSIKEYIPVLIEEIVNNYSGSTKIETTNNIEDIELALNKLQPLGIIINEAVTNSLKYAFHGRECGKIDVSAHLDKDLVHVEIKDNGVGLPEGMDLQDSSGFGFSLLTMLAQQLKGRIWLERVIGTTLVLEFEK